MNSLGDTIVEILPHVSRPSRYLPPIWNGRGRDAGGADVSWALLFPDVAESGYPHHGLEILYHLIDSMPGAAAERAFLPWTDMEEEMRRRGVPLFACETYRPLRDFDLLGITLQYELSYTNVLAAIDLAGLPLRAEERRDPFPLVVGGGPCAHNPEPLAPFFDLFLIGEGEEGVPELTDRVRRWKREGDGRKESLLDLLAAVRGVYVPSRHRFEQGAAGEIRRRDDAPPVRRLVVADLDRFPLVDRPLVPAIEPIHDRVYAEIARGCGVGCRFCQAGMIYRPLRERPAGEVVAAAARAVRSTGHESVSLASLSSGDHAAIASILRSFHRRLAAGRTGAALPSLRAATLTDEVIAEAARYRKSGFTIAPEAGSARMLRLVNKGIDREDVLLAAERAVRHGWSLLKLYFLIGLPTEEDEDVEGIATLVEEVWRLGRRVAKRGFRLNVSVSSLVPKPHTPFQWERQEGIEAIERKQAILRARLPRRGAITLKCHDPFQTEIEGVLARGDRRIAAAIEEAFRLGARFDEWGEMFSHDRWMEAFARSGVDPKAYLRERDVTEALPWDHIDSGVGKEFLLRERARARAGRPAPFCREGCRACRTCGDGLTVVRGRAAASAEMPHNAGPAAPPAEAKVRFRFRYTKGGIYRFLSHLELGRMFRLAVRRAALPVAYSQGFRPRVRLAFGPALPVGYAGKEEPIEILFHSAVLPGEVVRRLNAELPPGITLGGGTEVPLHGRSLDALPLRMEYDVRLPPGMEGRSFAGAARRFLASRDVPAEKRTKGKVRTVNLREGILGIDLGEGGRRALVRAEKGGRVADLLRHLAGGDERLARALSVCRKRVLLPEEEGKAT